MNNSFLKTIQRIVRYANEDDELGTDNIEMVVVSSQNEQNNDNQSTSSTIVTIENFKFVDNLMNYFNSAEVSNLINDHNKILLFKLKIANNSCNLNSRDLGELANKFSKNSVIIFLKSKVEENYYIYWKSSKIQKFLTTKINSGNQSVDYLKIFEFLVEFITNSLRNGRLGLHSEVKIELASMIEIHYFADHRNYNLLLIAAEIGDALMVEFCLNEGCRTKAADINAQILAYNGRHFEVLLLLLKSNLTYPETINIEECPKSIKDFYKVNRDLHEAIIMKDSVELLKTIEKYPEMRHFYNLKNESAPAFALRHKMLDMYGLLISNDIHFGENEKFSEIKKNLTTKELEKLREMHYDESKFLPDNHMHVLISNSRLASSTTDHARKYKIIQESFNILNSNPFIQIILMIVAASRYFRVVFDFNQNSIEHIDPTAKGTSRGMFYSFGRIYIASKQLLNPATKFEALGSLAHELCHYAVYLVYCNDGKPYYSNVLNASTEFEEISTICYENRDKEEIIRLVYDCYPRNEHHIELIVRVPHLVMAYINYPSKFEEVSNIFKKLFDFYKEKVMPQMEQALPGIEADAENESETKRSMIRCLAWTTFWVGLLALLGIATGALIGYILYTPFYEFNDLSVSDQNVVFNAPIIYKDVSIKLSDLFSRDAKAFRDLTSDHISQILNNSPLNLSDPHLLYLSQQVTHNWQNLTVKLKDKVLSSNFTFQNESLSFETLNKTYSEVFVGLNSSQILNILSGKELTVHKMIANETDFYFERIFFDEHIFVIYYSFKKKIDASNIFAAQFIRTEENERRKFFEEFYQEFEKKDLFTRLIQINKIKENRDFKELDNMDLNYLYIGKFVESLRQYTFLHLNYDKVVKTANETKLFILSAEAGTGKTASFEQFTMKIKKQFPSKWVSYIDLKDHKEFYKSVQNLQDVKDMLKKIFNLDPKDKFQDKLFDELFETGNMILLWNGFDEVSPEYSDDVIRIFRVIRINTKNIQFVCTRPLYSDQLSLEFRVKTYTLIPFDREEQINFIRSFLVSQKIEESKIPDYTLKIQKIALSADSEELFETPLLLLLVGDLVSNDVEIYESENLFKIYEKFIQKKIKIWFNNTEFGKKFSSGLIYEHRHFDMIKVYQSYAMKNEFQVNHRRTDAYYFCSKLKLMCEKVPEELTSDEISRMGLLYINGPKKISFTHRTFSEFFTALYLIENVYDSIDSPSEDEAKLRIRVFENSLNIDGVIRFIKSFLQTVQKNKVTSFDPQISNQLITQFQYMIIEKLEAFGGKLFPFMFEFFKKDPKVLKKLLQIDENQTAYTSIFSHVYLKSYETIDYKNNDEFPLLDLPRSYLSEDEYNRYINGKNQKGIILFCLYGMKLFRMKFNITYNDYKLDDNILKIRDPAEVFKEISKNLTSDEMIEFLKSKVAVRSIYYLQGFGKNINNGFNEKMWGLVEEKLTLNERKQVIRNFFIIFPNVMTALKIDQVMQFYLNKLDSHFNNTEREEILCETDMELINIHFSSFKFIWNSFINRISLEKQKSILKPNNANEYKFNLLLYSAFCNATEIIPYVVNIYESHFNKTEIQKMFLNAIDFLPLFIIRTEGNIDFIDYLIKIFKGSEEILVEFLKREVEPTKLNIFELYSGYFGPLYKLDKLSKLLESLTKKSSFFDFKRIFGG